MKKTILLLSGLLVFSAIGYSQVEPSAPDMPIVAPEAQRAREPEPALPEPPIVAPDLPQPEVKRPKTKKATAAKAELLPELIVKTEATMDLSVYDTAEGEGMDWKMSKSSSNLVIEQEAWLAAPVPTAAAKQGLLAGWSAQTNLTMIQPLGLEPAFFAIADLSGYGKLGWRWQEKPKTGWSNDLFALVEATSLVDQDPLYKPLVATANAFWTRLLPQAGWTVLWRDKFEQGKWSFKQTLTVGIDAENAWGRVWPAVFGGSAGLKISADLGGGKATHWSWLFQDSAEFSTGINAPWFKEKVGLALQLDLYNLASLQITPVQYRVSGTYPVYAGAIVLDYQRLASKATVGWRVGDGQVELGFESTWWATTPSAQFSDSDLPWKFEIEWAHQSKQTE